MSKINISSLTYLARIPALFAFLFVFFGKRRTLKKNKKTGTKNHEKNRKYQHKRNHSPSLPPHHALYDGSS
ncbi:MAG: hypothetical protein A3J37_06975 [Alphaproteobacteria bacterium RIFCSPHIGHO2_12_FULL_45_9]|nr:MAG: hypothetical protein A3B66_01225 [Alphaproteobacteria bacterium RIFCSPHIGHO2_02_FULL_46_13]OFW97951.1 MAG: hypothetical protein A3J37_06975 [Alphaproteobacteria bacterium RIFCSPHIGHO2_12_FULL_45_9]